jgi:hypothetical protein
VRPNVPPGRGCASHWPHRPLQALSSADGGEWQELLDLLIASLNLTRAPVTADERNELRSLAEAMELPADQLAELHVLG